MNQIQQYTKSRRHIADQNEIMLKLLFGLNPITDAEILALVAKRPELERFLGYVGTRPGQ